MGIFTRRIEEKEGGDLRLELGDVQKSVVESKLNLLVPPEISTSDIKETIEDDPELLDMYADLVRVFVSKSAGSYRVMYQYDDAMETLCDALSTSLSITSNNEKKMLRKQIFALDIPVEVVAANTIVNPPIEAVSLTPQQALARYICQPLVEYFANINATIATTEGMRDKLRALRAELEADNIDKTQYNTEVAKLRNAYQDKFLPFLQASPLTGQVPDRTFADTVKQSYGLPPFTVYQRMQDFLKHENGVLYTATLNTYLANDTKESMKKLFSAYVNDADLFGTQGAKYQTLRRQQMSTVMGLAGMEGFYVTTPESDLLFEDESIEALIVSFAHAQETGADEDLRSAIEEDDEILELYSAVVTSLASPSDASYQLSRRYDDAMEALCDELATLGLPNFPDTAKGKKALRKEIFKLDIEVNIVDLDLTPQKALARYICQPLVEYFANINATIENDGSPEGMRDKLRALRADLEADNIDKTQYNTEVAKIRIANKKKFIPFLQNNPLTNKVFGKKLAQFGSSVFTVQQRINDFLSHEHAIFKKALLIDYIPSVTLQETLKTLMSARVSDADLFGTSGRAIKPWRQSQLSSLMGRQMGMEGYYAVVPETGAINDNTSIDDLINMFGGQ